jgi:hypothetical protein
VLGEKAMIKNLEHDRIRRQIASYPDDSKFVVCTRCWNIVHSVRGGGVINNGSGHCKETVREVSKMELMNLLQ